ncbi:hypothetical protein [Sphingomonas sp. ERG5]|uniref:hypothetical protein n=1 Tax=Sphingomonas sp. ERG5 TaxID=1381597 RepID=UPI00054C590A|nr:hypothetical protein [Sphingomonas sp. ERG5]
MKTQAEDAVAQARAAETVAYDEQQAAHEGARIARDQWIEYLAQSGFAPDYSRALAIRLVARETAAENADQQHREAVDVHQRQQDIWRLAEARVRLTTDNLRNARRNVARHREEKRLDALSDRITYDWSRR